MPVQGVTIKESEVRERPSQPADIGRSVFAYFSSVHLCIYLFIIPNLFLLLHARWNGPLNDSSTSDKSTSYKNGGKTITIKQSRYRFWQLINRKERKYCQRISTLFLPVGPMEWLTHLISKASIEVVGVLMGGFMNPLVVRQGFCTMNKTHRQVMRTRLISIVPLRNVCCEGSVQGCGSLFFLSEGSSSWRIKK